MRWRGEETIMVLIRNSCLERGYKPLDLKTGGP
jgi:hypothetical protein